MPHDHRSQCFNHAVSETVPAHRLDKYLSELPELGLSRTQLQKLITAGLVTVNGTAVAARYTITGGEHIVIEIPSAVPSAVTPEELPLEIVYEDDYLVVVNKPAGMVTHPAVGNRTGTLVNALLFHVGSLATSSAQDRPGIVHRLDKETSGLLVVARTDEVYRVLQAAIQAREVQRTYLALVCGHLKKAAGTIDLPIGRSRVNHRKMVIDGVGRREAVTLYRVLSSFRSYDLLEVTLGTGRTHQIRVHLAHLGHPVFGDPEYGGREKWHRGMFGPDRPFARHLLSLLGRQALHAARLSFRHPVTGRELAFETSPPADFQAVLDALAAEQT